LQPVKVRSRCPPRAPCSDIRLAGRVTFRGKARVKSPRRPESDVSPGRIGSGGRATARAVAERTPAEASREGPRRKPMSGTSEEPTHCFGGEGHGAGSQGGDRALILLPA